MRPAVKAAVKAAQQEQRHEVDPDVLLRLVYRYISAQVPVTQAPLPRGTVARCYHSPLGGTRIEFRGYRSTAGGVVKLASTLMHEFTHAVKHFGAGQTQFADTPPDMFTAMFGYPVDTQVRMELEAELTAFGVISVFSSHPYYRRFTREYTQRWHGFDQRVDPMKCVQPELIQFFVNELESRL